MVNAGANFLERCYPHPGKITACGLGEGTEFQIAFPAVGTGVVTSTLGKEAVASMPADQAGAGSGINNTSRYVGAALGVTVVAVLAHGTAPGPLISGWNVACWVCAGTAVLGALVVLATAPARESVPV